MLFLTDIFPTGYQAAEQAGIKGGEIVAIWGTGPVGLFAIQSAKVLGAERIIAIETVPERIAMARKAGATDIIDFAKEDVFERIKEISKGEGADVVIVPVDDERPSDVLRRLQLHDPLAIPSAIRVPAVR